MATAQRGVITTVQLTALGLDSGAIRRRVVRGWLHPIFRGVYRVGLPAPLLLSDELAATLACGPGAFLSDRSAAQVWRFAVSARPGPVEVTVSRGGARSREGIRVKRRRLADADVTKRQGIPLTCPARTILDLAGTLGPIDLERAVAEAIVQGQVTDAQIRAFMKRAPKSKGTPILRAILDAEHGPKVTFSEFERKLLSLLRAAKLPEPECNVKVDGWRVDFVWREQRLVVEADSWQFHRSRARFERDHTNTADLKRAGFEVQRVTWRQMQDQPLAVVADIARVLGM